MAAPCKHFGTCGGCTLQSLAYPAQLAGKEMQVQQLIARLTGLGDGASAVMLPVVPAAQQYEYRNKLEFSFAPHAPGVLGFHQAGSDSLVVGVEECKLQSAGANSILSAVALFCKEHWAKLPPFDPGTKRGVLQHVVIRSAGAATSARAQPQYLVNVVTAGDMPVEAALMAALVERLLAAQPSVQSVVNSVVDRNRPMGERRIIKEVVSHGPGSLIESLCGLEFQVSPNSFFQTNTMQAQRLYELIAEAAGERLSPTAACGPGMLAAVSTREHPMRCVHVLNDKPPGPRPLDRPSPVLSTSRPSPAIPPPPPSL